MKTTSLRLVLIAALATCATGTAFAHAEGHAPAPAKPPIATEALPATMAETLTAIQSQLALLKTAQKEGKFSAVSANAVTLNQLVQHIVGQVPADHKDQVKEIADKHATITAELTRAAAAGAAKPVSDLVSKLGGNLRALQLFAH
ncbi:MAG: hypothetical protein ABII82_07915 [Verrucomicrobiota bacterium]